MGSGGGGAVARGIGRGLLAHVQNRNAQALSGGVSGADFANLLGLAGATPEQMAQAEQIQSAPPSAVSILLQSILQGAQPTFGGADFLSLLPESVGQIYSPEQRSRISQIQELDPSLSRGLIEILTDLASEQSAPRVALTPEMQQAGIVGDEQGFIPLDQFEEAQRVVESLIKEETYPYPRDVVESLPFLEGKFATLEDIQEAVELARAVEELGIKQSEKEKVLSETATFVAQNQGRFIKPETLRNWLQENYPGVNFFIPDPLESGEYAGRIDFDLFLERNQSLQNIANTAANTGLITTQIKGQDLQNQLRQFEIETFWDRHNEQLKNLKAQTDNILSQIRERDLLLPLRQIALEAQAQLDQARAAELETLLPFRAEQMAQDLLRGTVEIDTLKQQLENLRLTGKVTEKELEYLESTLYIRIMQEMETLAGMQAENEQTRQRTELIKNQILNLIEERGLIQDRRALTQKETERLEQQIQNLKQEYQLNDLEIREAEALLPFTIEEAAQRIARGLLDMEETRQRIENLRQEARISGATADYLEETLELRIRQEELKTQRDLANLRITVAEANKAEAIWEEEVRKIRLDNQKLAQEIEQGGTLFEYIKREYDARIDKLVEDGRISRAQADYLEKTATWRAGLMELEFQRQQQLMDEFPLHIAWEFLGLPGEPPPGFKIRNYQFDQLIDLLDRKRGTVLKARSIFEAAGVNTEDIPREVLDADVQVDGAGELVRALEGLRQSEILPVRTFTDLAVAIINAYTPSQLDDILMLSYLERNPDKATQVIGSRMEKLPPSIRGLVEDLFDMAAREVMSQAGVDLPGFDSFTGRSEPSNEVQFAANMAIAAAGSAKRAYDLAKTDRAKRLAVEVDPNSPFYNNGRLYDEYVEYLRRLAQAEGGE